MLEIPYNGSSVLTSSICMNKFKTNNLLRKNGFLTPKSLLVRKSNWLKNKSKQLENIQKKLKYALITKPHDDGCSVLVDKSKTKEELSKKINDYFLTNKNLIMIEECITGIELTVGVIGNNKPTALPPSQSVAKKDILTIEEKFLPGEGENQTPASLPEKDIKIIKKEMEQIYSFLNCRGYARLDCFYNVKSKQVTLIEVNSLPGLTPATCLFHQGAEIGIKPMELIDKIVEFGFEEHLKQINIIEQNKVKQNIEFTN